MNRDERRGITVLVLLIFILAVIVCYLQWFRPPKVHDMAAMEAQMAAWITELETEHDTVEIKPFPFDPNTIGREEWRALGLTDKHIDGLERRLAPQPEPTRQCRSGRSGSGSMGCA